MMTIGLGQSRRLPSTPVKGLAASLLVTIGFVAGVQPLTALSRTSAVAMVTPAAAAEPARTAVASIGEAAVPAWIAGALAGGADRGGDGAPILRHFDGLGLAVRPVNGKDRQVREDLARWLAAAIADERQAGARGNRSDGDDPLHAVLRDRAQSFRPGSPSWPSIRAIRYAPGPAATAGDLHFEVSLIGSAITVATLDVERFAAVAIDAAAAGVPMADSTAIVPLMP